MLPCYDFAAALWRRAGELLQPDDVAFSVLVRGYGEAAPPQWAAISAVLGRMQQQYGMKPGSGAPPSPAARHSRPSPPSPPAHCHAHPSARTCACSTPGANGCAVGSRR